jgi:hypothetical protein
LLRALQSIQGGDDDDDDNKGASRTHPLASTAIFTSPLRRAVGTLLALETVVKNDAASPPPFITNTANRPTSDPALDPNSDQTFRRKLFDDIEMGQAPDRDTQEEDVKFAANDCQEESRSPGSNAGAALTTRAVILNGLCDCAAQVSALQGAGWILRSCPGLLPCADAPIQRSQRTLVKELDRMRIDRNNSCLLQRQRPAEARIQFCRVDTAPTLRVVPMHAVDDGDPPQTAGRSNVSNDSVPYESFIKAVNRAVVVAGATATATAADPGGCDKVVIVGHREGIRELARESCRHRRSTRSGGDRDGSTDPHRIHTFYCCIAVFTVDLIVEDDHDSLVPPRVENWTFHGCHDYQSFDATCLPPHKYTDR